MIAAGGDPTVRYLVDYGARLWGDEWQIADPDRGDMLLAREEIWDYSETNRRRLSAVAWEVVDVYRQRYTYPEAASIHVEQWACTPEPTDDGWWRLHGVAHRLEAHALVVLAESMVAHTQAHITLRPAQAVWLCVRAAEAADFGRGRAEGKTAALAETLEIVRGGL